MAENKKQADDKFSPAETQQRFEAALRGARITGHKLMKEVSPKRKPAKRASPKKRG